MRGVGGLDGRCRSGIIGCVLLAWWIVGVVGIAGVGWVWHVRMIDGVAILGGYCVNCIKGTDGVRQV